MTQPRTTTQALADLRAALHDLIDPVERKVLRDSGIATSHRAPSLLDQLRAAASTSGESGRGGRGGRSTIPVDPAAVDLMGEIATGVEDMHARALEHSRPTVEDLLRGAVAMVERWDDPVAIDWAVGWLGHWRRAVLAQLDPPRRYHLAAPCPACHVTMVTRHNGTEDVQTPTLLIDTTTGAECQSCGAHWTRDQFEHLNLVIRSVAS
jgi:hypothetical protein